jgi:hypothetical protein
MRKTLFTMLLLSLLTCLSSYAGDGGRAPLAAGPDSRLHALSGATYHVRTDGGSATQCTGLVDAPYPGGGTDQPCAWDHPFRALPPGGSPRIAGGDALIIWSGSYRMGLGAPGADDCESDWPYECHMPPVPSGPDPTHPTRILGACAAPPELWGTERTDMILNLTDSSHVEISCLEVTDHSSCVEFHSGGLACERENYPYGDWAGVGLYAEDSADVYLHDLDIHGLANTGVIAARLTGWIVEDVRVAGNGWAGWDGDIEGDDSNAGTLRFRRWTVEWNGCGETWPDEEPTGCWAQTAGGYGDGVGTGPTGGDWIIEDSLFLHNTSDGLDLLYHSLAGRVVLDRVRAEGNAGNQVKITGEATIVNSVLVGNCAFFEGQPFTYHVDPCRALGNTLEVVYTGGESISIVNSTLYGQGDGLVCGGAREGYSCDGSETLMARNTVFVGDEDFFSPDDISFLFHQAGCGDLRLDSDYNLVYNAKNVTCGTSGNYVDSGGRDLCQDPQLLGPLAGEDYGMELTAGSPAIDAASAACAPAWDYEAFPRLGVPDIGALEYSMLRVTPLSRAIDPGEVITYAVEVRPLEGSTATIALSTASPSPSLALRLAPTGVAPPGRATLTVTDTHPGPVLLPGLWYSLPVTATGGVIQSTAVNLLVGGLRLYLPVLLRSL